MPFTPYADLDDVLGSMLTHWRDVLGDDLAGAWLQGSFALGAGDRLSDCDFLVATHRPLTDAQVAGLRTLHDEVPSRDGYWWQHLEGSYAPLFELADAAALGRRWLFMDHGHRTLTWDDHCNRGYTRWILHQHGVVLAGPEPAEFMSAVDSTVLRREAAGALPTLLDELTTWIDIDAVAWGQRYAVQTACRTLFTHATARVASKAGALEWAMRTLDPRWRPLLGQVRDDRALGWQLDRPPGPGEADAARAFVLEGVRSVVAASGQAGWETG